MSKIARAKIILSDYYGDKHTSILVELSDEQLRLVKWLERRSTIESTEECGPFLAIEVLGD